MAQPRKTTRQNQTPIRYSNKLLQKAFVALWKRTDENGVCQGNGKIPTLRSELGITEAQANHIVSSLRELQLLSWNSKRGMGAEYKVVVEMPTITREMAEQALAVVGPFPKAKTQRSAPAQASVQTSRRAPNQTTKATPTQEEPELEQKVQGLIAAAERLLQEVLAANETKLRVIADNDLLREKNASLQDENTQLKAQLSDLRTSRSGSIADMMAKIDIVLEQEALVTAPRPSLQTH